MVPFTILRPRRWPIRSGRIVLTFDDGPTADVTPALLDALGQRGVTASFCLIGREARQLPGIVQRIHKEGHAICGHSYIHGFPVCRARSFHQREIDRNLEALRNALGRQEFTLTHYRPPMGLYGFALKRELRQRRLEWAWLSFYHNDAWAGRQSGGSLVARCLDSIRRNHGGAMVLHERRYPNALSWACEIDKTWLPGAVGHFIDQAHQEGFEFATYADEPDGPSDAGSTP